MCGTPCSRRQVLQLLHAMVCNDYGVMAHPVAEGRCYISRQIPDCSDENCLTLFLSGWTADFPLSRALSCSRKNRTGYSVNQFLFSFSSPQVWVRRGWNCCKNSPFPFSWSHNRCPLMYLKCSMLWSKTLSGSSQGRCKTRPGDQTTIQLNCKITTYFNFSYSRSLSNWNIGIGKRKWSRKYVTRGLGELPGHINIFLVKK